MSNKDEYLHDEPLDQVSASEQPQSSSENQFQLPPSKHDFPEAENAQTAGTQPEKLEVSNRMLLTDILAIFKGRDRSKRYATFLDVLPLWSFVILLSLIILFFVVAVAIAVFGSADSEAYATVIHNTQLDDVYNGNIPINHTITALAPDNLSFIWSVSFNYNRTYVGIFKENALLKVRLEARNSDSEAWIQLTDGYTNQLRRLICFQDSIGSVSDTSSVAQDCRPMNVFYQRNIPYTQYRASVFVRNLQDVYQRGLISGPITTVFQYTSIGYTRFELGFRILFSFLVIIEFILLLVILFRAQQFKYWHTSQRWLVVLLFLEIFFHDPIFFGQAFLGFFGFPLLNVIFTLTFTFGFLFYLLIFFHSLFKKKEERTICSFYFTKLLVVAPIYIVAIVLLTWSRVYNYADSSVASPSDIPGFLYLQAIVLVLLGVYAACLLYYVFRAIGAATQKKIAKRFSTRFKVVGSFSFLVLLSLSGVTIAGQAFPSNATPLTFLLSHWIIFTYFSCLCLFFLPSAREIILAPKKPSMPEANPEDIQMTEVNVDAQPLPSEQPTSTVEPTQYEQHEEHQTRLENHF